MIVEIGSVENMIYGECCTWLYNTTLYDGKAGVEKIKNNDLKGYNGGDVILKNADGSLKRTILHIEKITGKDLQP